MSGQPRSRRTTGGLDRLPPALPDPGTAYIGILLVAEPFQRQRVGTNAWALLEPWLAAEGGVREAKVGVEQFNPGALRFFQFLGFT